METKRAVYKVGHAPGWHARPATLLYARLHSKAPRAKVYLRRADAEDARTVGAEDLYYYGLRLRYGEEVAVSASGPDAEMALRVAGEVIVALDELPTHYELGVRISPYLPIVGASLRSYGPGH